MISLVDRQPAELSYGNGGVTGQPLGEWCRHIGQGDTRRSERVVACDLPARGVGRYMARCRATADILHGLFLEVPVERFGTAAKALPVMPGSKHLDPEFTRHYCGSWINLKCVFLARFKDQSLPVHATAYVIVIHKRALQ